MKPWQRRTLLVTAGAAAAGLGGFVAWRRTAPAAPGPASAPPHADATPAASPEALWNASLIGLDGQPFSAAQFRGRPLLVNFWATWCPPCIRELPEINQFYAEAKGQGWQVLGIAVDGAEPVKTFLQKMPLGFPIAIAGAAGLGLVRQMGNFDGGLPFSVILNEAGEIRWIRIGTTRLDELRALAKS